MSTVRFLWHGQIVTASLDADRHWVFGDERLAEHLNAFYGPHHFPTAEEQLNAVAARLAGATVQAKPATATPEQHGD
jgi:hypothetical protein